MNVKSIKSSDENVEKFVFDTDNSVFESVLSHDLQSRVNLIGADFGGGDSVSVSGHAITTEEIDSSGNTCRRVEVLPLRVSTGNRPIVSSDFEHLRALERKRSGNGSKND